MPNKVQAHLDFLLMLQSLLFVDHKPLESYFVLGAVVFAALVVIPHLVPQELAGTEQLALAHLRDLAKLPKNKIQTLNPYRYKLLLFFFFFIKAPFLI